jgi:antitoxin HicB
MKTTADYLDLPYHLVMVRDETPDGGLSGWVVWVEELPGCVSQGETPEDAIRMIREAMEAWIEAALDAGDEIPPPREEAGFSGRFVLRIPSSLHAALDAGARREGVSMNQYAATLLAGAIGWKGRREAAS